MVKCRLNDPALRGSSRLVVSAKKLEQLAQEQCGVRVWLHMNKKFLCSMYKRESLYKSCNDSLKSYRDTFSDNTRNIS